MGGDDESSFEEIARCIRENPEGGINPVELDEQLFLIHAHESPQSFLRRALADREFTSRIRPGQKSFELPLPQNYRPQDCLRFLARDAQAVSERVYPDGFDKAFPDGDSAAVLQVRFHTRHDGITAHCETDAGSSFAGLRVAQRLLGLHTNAAEFEQRFATDPLLGRLISSQRGLHIPLSATPWEGLVWAIAGQQITLRAAITMRRELLLAHGTRHSTGLIAHPAPSALARLNPSDLLPLKFSRAKSEYITGTARAVVDGILPLDSLASMSARRAARLLLAVRGIGPWTVQYCMLRALGFQDCLPASDAGLAQGLERMPEVGRRLPESGIRELLDRFTPFRSLATCHIWASL